MFVTTNVSGCFYFEVKRWGGRVTADRASVPSAPFASRLPAEAQGHPARWSIVPALPGGLPFLARMARPRLGRVGPWPRLPGLGCHKPRTSGPATWGAWAPGPVYRGLGATSPKRPYLPGRARSDGSRRERGLDHETARWTGRTAGGFIQDGSCLYDVTWTHLQLRDPRADPSGRHIGVDSGTGGGAGRVAISRPSARG